MLNPILAGVAFVVWSASYVLFFRRDLRRWWLTRDIRRARAAWARAQRERAFADWVRNLPPPRPRPKVKPGPAPPAHSGTIVPFPSSQRRRPSSSTSTA